MSAGDMASWLAIVGTTPRTTFGCDGFLAGDSVAVFSVLTTAELVIAAGALFNRLRMAAFDFRVCGVLAVCASEKSKQKKITRI